MDEQLQFLLDLTRRLDAAGIPYMLSGSLAMAVYATPRMTRDIDIVIQALPEAVPRLVAVLARDCYVDAEAAREAVSRRTMFNVIHGEWMIKADLIVCKDDLFHQGEFLRRRTADVGGVPVQVVSPEDLILSKLLWGAPSGSELQRRDVAQLLDSVADIDWIYLERWAAFLQVAEELRRARGNR